LTLNKQQVLGAKNVLSERANNIQSSKQS